MWWTLGLVLSNNYENYEGSSIFGQFQHHHLLFDRKQMTASDDAQHVDGQCMWAFPDMVAPGPACGGGASKAH